MSFDLQHCIYKIRPHDLSGRQREIDLRRTFCLCTEYSAEKQFILWPPSRLAVNNEQLSCRRHPRELSEDVDSLIRLNSQTVCFDANTSLRASLSITEINRRIDLLIMRRHNRTNCEWAKEINRYFDQRFDFSSPSWSNRTKSEGLERWAEKYCRHLNLNVYSVDR